MLLRPDQLEHLVGRYCFSRKLPSDPPQVSGSVMGYSEAHEYLQVRWPDGSITLLRSVTDDSNARPTFMFGLYDAKIRADGNLEIV